MPFRRIIEKYSQTVGLRTEIDEIMSIALLLQRFLGHQVLDPKWTWKNFYHYKVFLFLLLTYVVLGTVDVIQQPDTDTELAGEAAYTLLVIVICPIKLFIFIANRNNFRKLYLDVKTTLLDLIREETSGKVQHVLRQAKITVYFLFSMVVLPFAAYESVTLWNYLNGNRTQMSQSSNTLVPMTTPFYEISWFFHSMFMIEISSIVIVMDMWFVFLMSFMNFAIESLITILDVEKQYLDETDDEYSKRLGTVLKKFYKAHVKMVRYTNNLSKMYKWLALVPLVNTGLSICIILLVLSEGLHLKFAAHAVPVFGEVFAYNWYGEQLKEKMLTLQIALWNFDWTSLKKKDLQSYYVMVSYMSKNFGIKTAIGYDLSLITLSAVLKTSYQAFTVLQTMQ